MTWILVGCVLLGLLLGGAGMRASGRFARRNWRPGASVLALGLFVAAAALGLRGAYGASLLLMLVGGAVSMSARRVRPQAHRRSGGGEAARKGAYMSPEEARAILGVEPGASAQEVQQAYLRLIRRTHPDAGGTAGLAAQLNAARDVLLNRRG